jgi:hypothetical protein
MTEEVDSLLDLSEDELYARLGQSTGKGAMLPELVERGKSLFANTMKNIAEKLCNDPRTIALHDRRDEITLADYVAGLADIVTGFVAGITPNVLALLIVKNNLDKICGTFWKEGSGGKTV